MKIAVCFSGQPRFIQEYEKNIKLYLLNLYDVDIYAHFWWDKSLKGTRINMGYNDIYDERDYIQEFINTYHPKNIQYEPQKKFNIEGFCLDTIEPDLKNAYSCEQFKELYQRVHSQWYSLQKCYQSIEHPENYDFIIRIRTDCKLNGHIQLNHLHKDRLYIQDGKCTGYTRKYADWFMVGHANVMKEFVNIYNHIYDYWHKGSIHIHRFIQSYVEDFSIPNEAIEFNTRIEHIHYKK